MWDGERDRGVMRVSVEDDLVVEMEPYAQDRYPGFSLIPGLIDTHVHLMGYAGADAVDYLTWPLVTPVEERVLHAVAQAQRALRVGVTTVRDMAGGQAQVSVARALNQGILLGPRVLVHGMVGMTAGHGDLFTPPTVADRPPTADGADACRRLVRQYARMGVDGIKITTSGGVLSTGDRSEWRNYTAAELDAIVDEAHALALPVAAHAHTESGIQAALDAGVDSLEHATQITADQAKTAAARDITVAPTLLILERIVAGQARTAPEMQRKAEALHGGRRIALRRAYQAGVPFVLGTDSSGSAMPFGQQWEELATMVTQIGLSAEEALVAATSRAARAVGLAGRIGRIAPRCAADLVLVQGRPWEDARALAAERVAAVMTGGRLAYGTWPDPVSVG